MFRIFMIMVIITGLASISACGKRGSPIRPSEVVTIDANTAS